MNNFSYNDFHIFRRKACDVFEGSAGRTNERRAEVGIKIFVPDYKRKT